MKKVVSLAIFGESASAYARYLATFVRAHHALFPRGEGWELRVHVDPAAGCDPLLRALASRGLLDVVECAPAPRTRAMLWRMRPVWDPSVDYVFPRDLDALPTPRDRACCDVFVRSGLDVHAMHDSSSHDGVMGGMSGYACESFREIAGLGSWEDLVRFGNKTEEEWARHGTDQDVLNALILGWGRAAEPRRPFAVFEHRYSGWAAGRPGPGGRAPSSWATISEPVPDLVSAISFLRDRAFVGGELDALAPHIGAAGYDAERASAFYDEYGPPEIMKSIREAEKECM